jgi:thymidylate kinase
MNKSSESLLTTHPESGRTTHGLFVVIIGPDGSGKSTLVERALDELAREFRATWRFHWRPGLLPKPAVPSADNTPSAAPPKAYAYGRLLSLVRYLYYLADFIMGYWALVYPRKLRATLVLGERWYYDVIVNPQRYGFHLPAWLLRLGGRLVPRPDLTILLEAPAEEIHARKPELSVEELHVQFQKMRAVLPDSGCRISTQGSIEKSVGEMVCVVLNRAQRGFTSAHRTDIVGVDRWRAFPRNRRAKLWIHARDSMTNAMHLYHPYSWVGQTIIRVVAYLPRRVTTLGLAPEDEQGLHRLTDAIRRMLNDDSLVASFYTGTPDYTGVPNAHRKVTAQVSRDGVITAYVKIGSSDAAKKLIRTETLALSRLPTLPAGVSAPRVLAQSLMGDEVLLLALSPPPVPGRQRSKALDEFDMNFLISLAPARAHMKSVKDVLDAIGLDVMNHGARDVYPELITQACEVIGAILGHGVRVGPVHGDYVPWNTLALNDGSLYVYDWEHAAEAPLLGDLFHRVFMPDRLINHGIPARAAMSNVLELCGAPLVRPLLEKCGIGATEFPAYLLLYFLRIAAREAHEKGNFDAYLQECIHLALEFAHRSGYVPRPEISLPCERET